jgi:hypothetical protein
MSAAGFSSTDRSIERGNRCVDTDASRAYVFDILLTKPRARHVRLPLNRCRATVHGVSWRSLASDCAFFWQEGNVLDRKSRVVLVLNLSYVAMLQKTQKRNPGATPLGS